MKKNRSNSVRTYDTEGYTQRAGCLCFKTDQENEVLLVSSSRVPGRWVVPAGGVEPGERSENAATREVEEEAGVRGNIGRFLGIFQNDSNKTRTAVYVLIVTEELETWEESINGRQRQWFSVDRAIELLSCRPIQQKYLSEAKNSRFYTLCGCKHAETIIFLCKNPEWVNFCRSPVRPQSPVLFRSNKGTGDELESGSSPSHDLPLRLQGRFGVNRSEEEERHKQVDAPFGFGPAGVNRSFLESTFAISSTSILAPAKPTHAVMFEDLSWYLKADHVGSPNMIVIPR